MKMIVFSHGENGNERKGARLMGCDMQWRDKKRKRKREEREEEEAGRWWTFWQAREERDK